jgi:hypothetical protein
MGWITEQILNPVVPLSHRFMGGIVNVRDVQHLCRLPARQAEVQQCDP